MKKLTPVLVVDSIEAGLPFLIDRLGFTKSVEVPAGDRLGFVIFDHNPAEVMLRSRASVAEVVPDPARDAHRSALFIEVEDLAPLLSAVKGLEIVVPERTTFYGAREIAVRDPAGNVVNLSHFARH